MRLTFFSFQMIARYRQGVPPAIMVLTRPLMATLRTTTDAGTSVGTRLKFANLGLKVAPWLHQGTSQRLYLIVDN